jgi:MarR family transcriptional regulator for hemolysin
MTTTFDSPRSRFGIEFSLLAKRWRRAIEKRLDEAGLTDATWVPLVHLLRSGGGITQKDLAALIGIDASSLVRLLDILQRRGLVERRPDPNDGRARLIHLTEEGGAAVHAIRAELLAEEELLLADLGDDDLAHLLDLFRRIDARLDARLDKGRDWE